jgi:predicted metalloprotease with PDZ domain
MRRALLLLLTVAPVWAQAPIRLRVDATAAPRRVFHVEMHLPSAGGPTTLLYPQWIPGDHSPDGPVVQLAGLAIQAEGHKLPWRRDSVNMYAFQVDAPPGTGGLDIAFDFLAPPEGQFSSGSSTTAELAVLNWNQFVLYPQGADPDRLPYQATLRLPEGWKFGTALPVARQNGGEIEFEPVPLTTLIDSPLSAGVYYRTIELGEAGGVPHFLHLVGDSEKAIDMSDDQIAHYRALTVEANALFGAHHYRSYHFLYSLSDHVAHFGLEHHESSDDRLGERAVIDDGQRVVEASLLPHEFVHSWNGKYRRPAGLTSGGRDGGYDTPMKGDLLWVYEGLTEYLGSILTPRAGLQKPEEYREDLAYTAATLDAESGRKWRPLEDTAIAAQLYYFVNDDYIDYRRGVDYYPEGELLWLDVDAHIRQLTSGRKSLDDFCKAFHGAPSTPPGMKTYEFDDLVAGLNGVAPFDWAAFLNQRLTSVAAATPVEAVASAGWKLVYDDARPQFLRYMEDASKQSDFTFSLGFRVRDDDSSVADVVFGGPVQRAGIIPGVKLIAVNNRQYSSGVLRDALKAASHGGPAIELLVKNGEYYQTHRIDYRGGERYPHLVRDESKPDLLAAVIAPLVKQ